MKKMLQLDTARTVIYFTQKQIFVSPVGWVLNTKSQRQRRRKERVAALGKEMLSVIDRMCIMGECRVSMIE